MPDTGSTISPKVQKGAFVQLIRDLVGVIPHIVAFQYNPARLARAVTPWNPFEAEPTQQGIHAPAAQPFEPKETWNLELELDATDGMEDGNPIASTTGVASQIAALRKLVVATEGLAGDVKRRAQALKRQATQRPARPTVPIVLFVWGAGRILPVRITSFSVDEELFLPNLFPTQAKVTIAFEVLTPESFKCKDDTLVKLAVAAYNATRLNEDTLAAANAANSIDQIRALLPF